MKPIAVARRYAQALADAAGKDAILLDRIASDLRLAAETLGRDPRLPAFFADPSVDGRQKLAAIEALARTGKLQKLSASFLRVLVSNRRIGALDAIVRAFEGFRDERLGIVEAETTSAVPLSAPETRRLKESLEKLTGKSVRLKLHVDPALLGGARTRIGSQVYDGTLRRQLAVLRERLAQAR
ncbi:MAG: ATP synthase F1 subunit delta [Candidatus Polarisedimenticolia bacterium]